VSVQVKIIFMLLHYNARICQDNMTFNFISTKHLFH